MTTLDYSALTAPYDRAAGEALAAQLRASGPSRRRFVGMGVAIDVTGLIGFGLALLLFAPLTVSALVGLLTAPNQNSGVLFVFMLVFTAARSTCSGLRRTATTRPRRSSPSDWWARSPRPTGCSTSTSRGDGSTSTRTEFAMGNPQQLAELFGFIDIVRDAKL